MARLCANAPACGERRHSGAGAPLARTEIDGVLVLALAVRACAGGDLPRCLRRRRRAVHPAARRAWIGAGRALGSTGPVPLVAEPLLSSSARHRIPHRRLGWRGPLHPRVELIAAAMGIAAIRARV